MKSVKIITILFLIIILSISTFTFAVSNPDDYKPGEVNKKDSEKMGEITGNILARIRTMGIFLSVIVLTIIGIKYMLGSTEEKANYKENAIPYIAGVSLLAATTVLPSLIWDIVH